MTAEGLRAAAWRDELLRAQSEDLGGAFDRLPQLGDDDEETRAADEARAAEYRREAVGFKDKARRYRAAAVVASRRETRTVPRVIRPGATRTPRARRAVGRARSRSPGRLADDPEPEPPVDRCPRCGHSVVVVRGVGTCAACWATTVLSLEQRS